MAFLEENRPVSHEVALIVGSGGAEPWPVDHDLQSACRSNALAEVTHMMSSIDSTETDGALSVHHTVQDRNGGMPIKEVSP